MRVIRAGLSESSIHSAISQLEAYRAGLANKSRIALNRLGQIGINTANANKGTFAQYIIAERSHSESAGGSVQKESVDIRQTETVPVSWQAGGGVKTVRISPLMMAEYGSGKYALPGHRGTFPGQKHAWEDVWYWRDLEGNQHHSSGVTPTRPGFRASIEIQNNLDIVVREVFGSG